MMKAKLYAVVGMIVSAFSLFSCIGDSETSTTSVTNDCAITNVVLGTLQRTVTTRKSSGKDTTYLTTLYGAYYPMYIDQLKQEIYNADSLPVGTNVKSVIFSTFTSDGVVAYRLESGADTVYNSKDSLDFTSPRIFTCYAYSGNAKKSYTLRVNVRKSNPDLFVWNKVGEVSEFESLQEQKILPKGNDLYLFAKQGTNKKVFKASMESPASWDKNDMSGDVPTNTNEIVLFQDKFWGSSNDVLVFSENGLSWSKAGVQGLTSVKALAGASGTTIYAKGEDALYCSHDGLVWTKEDVDADYSKMPSSNMSFAGMAMEFNSNFENLLWAGTTDNNETVLWKKTFDKSGENDDVWSYYPFTEEIKSPLPTLKSPVMFEYDDRFLYLGCLNDTVSAFYESEDAGRNWIAASNVYVHPRGIRADNISCAVDENHFVWLVCSGSGEVWRGRLNRLAFPKNQTAFTD